MQCCETLMSIFHLVLWSSHTHTHTHTCTHTHTLKIIISQSHGHILIGHPGVLFLYYVQSVACWDGLKSPPMEFRGWKKSLCLSAVVFFLHVPFVSRSLRPLFTKLTKVGLGCKQIPLQANYCSLNTWIRLCARFNTDYWLELFL